ncbi:MAG: hypothetical protein WEG36_07640 [Gemmatimonadota bacterium]
MLWALTWEPCRETGLFGCLLELSSRGDAAGYGIIAGTLIGIPVRLIVGLAAESERWEQLTVGDGQGALTMRPIVGREFGLAASVALAWR